MKRAFLLDLIHIFQTIHVFSEAPGAEVELNSLKLMAMTRWRSNWRSAMVLERALLMIVMTIIAIVMMMVMKVMMKMTTMMMMLWLKRWCYQYCIEQQFNPASQMRSTITPTSIYQHNMKSRVRPIRNSGFNGNLTLPMPRLLSPKNKDAQVFESHLNPVMLVFIGLLLLSTIRWVPMCNDIIQFIGFCFILDVPN